MTLDDTRVVRHTRRLLLDPATQWKDRTVQAIRRNPGAITAVTIGLLLITAAGWEDDTRPYEVAQLAVGGALILAGCALPHLERIVGARGSQHCDPYELGQVETCVMDRIAEVEKLSAEAIGQVADELARLRASLEQTP